MFQVSELFNPYVQSRRPCCLPKFPPATVDLGLEKTWTWTEPFRGVEPFWPFLAFVG